MEPIHGDKLRGHLEAMILSTLERGEAHGLEILRRLEEAGCGLLRLKEGSLYPALYRLEAAGEVKAAWEAETHGRRGARRRIHRLTAKGTRKLNEGRAEWQQFVLVLGGILGAPSMNESTRTQLMILVERAVRPVQASTPRKRTMREELLTHVTAVFEEETAKLGDDSAALERAALRFGNPAELTSQLQETVPASDRFARFWEGQPDESPLRAATRLAMMALALALVIFFGLLFAGGARPVLQSEAILLCAPNLFALPLYLFSLAFLADWMRKALYGPAGRSWLKFALIAVGWWVLSLLMMVALPFLKGAWDADSDLWVAVVFASWVGNPLCPYALARSAADRLRYHQEWASLRIDG